MTKVIKKKFITVTIALIFLVSVILIGIFAGITYRGYQDENVDIMHVLVDACRNFEDSGETIGDEFLTEYSDSSYMITKLVIGPDNQVISIERMGKSDDPLPGDDVIRKVLESEKMDSYFGRYVYSKEKLQNGNTLCLIVHFTEKTLQKSFWIGIIAALIIGLVMMSLIAAYLSGYVTRPATEAVEREKRFIADASHQLKTPLSTIGLNAQIIERDYPENIQAKSILSAIDRMSRLIDRLLTLSHLEEVKSDMNEDVDFSEVINEIALSCEGIAYERGISISSDVEDGVVVRGNRSDLYQMAVTLVDNAIKHTEKNGDISIGLYMVHGKAVLEVKNTGEAIPEDSLPHIFDRFYSTGSSEDSSFGLGLAIAKAIAENHKCEIKAENLENGITCFTVKI